MQRVLENKCNAVVTCSVRTNGKDRNVRGVVYESAHFHIICSTWYLSCDLSYRCIDVSGELTRRFFFFNIIIIIQQLFH